LTAGRDQKSRHALSAWRLFVSQNILRILFFEDFDNVFRVDANRVGFAKEENDMKISWRAKLSWVVERVLRAIRQANWERSERLPLYEIFYLTKSHWRPLYTVSRASLPLPKKGISLPRKLSGLSPSAVSPTAQLKEQAAQIQKVSAQIEVNKPAPQVVANKP